MSPVLALYVPAGDVDVEDDEDEERDEEEDGDDDDEVELGPPVVHRGEAGRHGRAGCERRDGDDGRSQPEREQPRDEARQARLRLGPHDARLRTKRLAVKVKCSPRGCLLA